MDRIFTGFDSLDSKTIIKKGELAVVAGRPATGKTSFVCTMLKNTCEKQKSMLFGVNFTKHKAITSLKDSAGDSVEFVSGLYGVEEVVLKICEKKLNDGLDLVVIDNFYDFLNYVYLPQRECARLLCDIAKRLNVAIIVVDSLIREEHGYENYSNIVHKELLRFSSVILTLFPYSNYDCVEFGLAKDTVCVSAEKDVKSYMVNEVRLKFDKKALTFLEI